MELKKIAKRNERREKRVSNDKKRPKVGWYLSVRMWYLSVRRRLRDGSKPPFESAQSQSRA